ncbi:MAG: heavy metal-binding domain-containing protein [Planctomycetes bacterium]|nr:heavy metal-binding domain-containing protein [Planctomycetota bacterium]
MLPLEQGHELGANAIVEARPTIAMIAKAMAEILAFGTAVQIEPE